MIEFLAEWVVTLLSPATQIVKTRAPHLAFMFVKEYWFREFYLGLKVTVSLGREESYTRIIDGQVRCITQELIQKRGQLIWNVEFLTIFVPAWMIPTIYHSLCEKRKPKYTSCVPKSTLSYKTLRQTQTPTVVATPQLLSSLQCQNKGTCSTPTPKCTSELLLFSPDATVTRNRSTRTKDGTQPRNKEPKAPQAKGEEWQLFHLP